MSLEGSLSRLKKAGNDGLDEKRRERKAMWEHIKSNDPSLARFMVEMKETFDTTLLYYKDCDMEYRP